jgi:Putative zinc-finger
MTIESTEMNHECHRVEPMLDDLADGQLTAAERRRVEAHLATCAGCRRQLASLEALLEQVDALPRSLPPGADLWPAVAARLTARPRRAASAWPAWLRQAAAAVVFMALGGALSQLLAPAWRDSAWRGGAPEPVAEAARPTPDADFALAETGLCLAEADLLRAKEALWAAVYSSYDATASPERLPAETREVVEHNLGVIASAIQELRAALEADPGNPRLEDLLLAQHRSEIGLLRRLTRTAEI